MAPKKKAVPTNPKLYARVKAEAKENLSVPVRLCKWLVSPNL